MVSKEQGVATAEPKKEKVATGEMMRTIVITPTYNEAGNIKDLIDQTLAVDSDIHIVVVDDRSTDGTIEIVEELSRRFSRVHLFIRNGPRGRGLADLDGFRYAIKEGFDVILSLDADFSHQPKYIPEFLREIKNHDVVVGSRLIKGGRILGRGWPRNAVSQIANFYIRCFLGTTIKDWTSGFRCYRREVLVSLPLDTMSSRGPSLLVEILFLCRRGSRDICEIPITFIDRKRGKSKLGLCELLESLSNVLRLRFK